MRKLDSLQAYRGIAAILVVLYHVTVFSQERTISPFSAGFFNFGFTGVDFFFVLSGFIIFYVHSDDLGHLDRLPAYLRKRFNRIYPFYWVVTLVKIAAIVLVAGYAKSYEREASVIVKSMLLLPQPNLPIIGAAWTLTHEVLFYLLFAAMILLGARCALSIFVIWVTAIIGFHISGQLGLIETTNDYLLAFLLNPRNLEFVLGCLSGYLLKSRQIRCPSLWLCLGAILFLLAALYIDQGGSDSSMTLVLLFGVPSFLVVTGSSTLDKSDRIKFPALLVFLGDASYSIYLGAFAFVNLFSLILLRPEIISFIGPFPATLTITVMAIVGGAAAHVFVERPLRDLLKTKNHLPSELVVNQARPQ